MNKNQSVYIFSRAIRSGKTTQLMKWLSHKDNIAGFLTPDVDGFRMLLDIRHQKMHPFQVTESYQGAVATVGRFRFAMSAFDLGKAMLSKAPQDCKWVVIDEVGKLETAQGEGFEPAVLHLIRKFQSGSMNGNLLLVIRDTLLASAIDKYDLNGSTILNNLPVE